MMEIVMFIEFKVLIAEIIKYVLQKMKMEDIMKNVLKQHFVVKYKDMNLHQMMENIVKKTAVRTKMECLMFGKLMIKMKIFVHLKFSVQTKNMVTIHKK